MLPTDTCTAPELTEFQPFNGGKLLLHAPVPDQEGKYPARIVLVDLHHELATWLAVWPADRAEPAWYCTWGHYFSLAEGTLAVDDFEMRTERGF